MSDYRFGEEMLEAAQDSYNGALMFYENSGSCRNIMLLSQHTTECYLCSILETLTGKECDRIYGRGNVPHDLGRLYDDCHKYDKKHILPLYDRRFRRELLSAFYDYKAIRYPKPDIMRVVDREAVSYNVDIMQEVRDLAENFIEKYHELQSKDNMDVEK